MQFLGLLMDEPNRGDEARVWLERAFERGDTLAAFALGAMLDTRDMDKAEAERLYLMTAMQGNIDAMNNLGMLLSDKGDDANAAVWLREATKHGHPGAKNHPLARDSEVDESEAAVRYWRFKKTLANLYIHGPSSENIHCC